MFSLWLTATMKYIKLKNCIRGMRKSVQLLMGYAVGALGYVLGLLFSALFDLRIPRTAKAGTIRLAKTR